MPKIHFLPKFDKAYIKFTRQDKKRVQAIDKALKLFKTDPKHPSLNLEKLIGSDVWSIRVDRGNRIFFIWGNDDTAILFFVGLHDVYRMI